MGALEVLAERLLERRARVRELITAFKESARAPFPNWGKAGENGDGRDLGAAEGSRDGEGGR
jgi:hypothetical protein